MGREADLALLIRALRARYALSMLTVQETWGRWLEWNGLVLHPAAQGRLFRILGWASLFWRLEQSRQKLVERVAPDLPFMHSRCAVPLIADLVFA